MEIEHTRTENEQQAHQELRRGLGARPFVALCSPALLLFRLQVLEDAREPTHVHCDLLKLGHQAMVEKEKQRRKSENHKRARA